MKIMSPYQKLHETQKNPKKSLPKSPQKRPKTTQKLMHKKQKKFLIQGVEKKQFTPKPQS